MVKGRVNNVLFVKRDRSFANEVVVVFAFFGHPVKFDTNIRSFGHELVAFEANLPGGEAQSADAHVFE